MHKLSTLSPGRTSLGHCFGNNKYVSENQKQIKKRFLSLGNLISRGDKPPLREKSPNTELFMFRILCIRTKYGDLRP